MYNIKVVYDNIAPITNTFGHDIHQKDDRFIRTVQILDFV